MRTLLRLILLAGIGYAAWQYLKGAQAGQAPTPQQPAPMSPPSKPKAAAKSAASNGAGASKAELYERATELGIKGRSKMSKAELERAIRDAG